MDTKPGRHRPRETFTEQARRAEIVAAAIDVVAEQGYAQASLTRIARQAGLSTLSMTGAMAQGGIPRE